MLQLHKLKLSNSLILKSKTQSEPNYRQLNSLTRTNFVSNEEKSWFGNQSYPSYRWNHWHKCRIEKDDGDQAIRGRMVVYNSQPKSEEQLVNTKSLKVNGLSRRRFFVLFKININEVWGIRLGFCTAFLYSRFNILY
jgi:hypothetical protein